MMRLSMGYIARPTHRQPPQPVHEVILLTAAGGTIASASGTGALQLVVGAPSPHAGSYRVHVADLAQGPVCLMPPGISDPDGSGATLRASDGLWACDTGLGPVSFTGQWQADDQPLAGQNALQLTVDQAIRGQSVRYRETADQAGQVVQALSAAMIATPPDETPVDPEPDPDPEPQPDTLQLVSLPDATMQIVSPGDAPFTVTVSEPAAYAGSYDVLPADLAQGPICLVPPAISGFGLVDEMLTVRPGLWIQDLDAGALTLSGQWQADGVALNGQTGLTYQIQMADQGRTLTYVETCQDNHGNRQSGANMVEVVRPGAKRDSFTAEPGTPLSAYMGESGIGWDASDGNYAIVGAGNVLESAAANSNYLQRRNDPVDPDQFAEARMVMRSTISDQGLGPAVRVLATRTGYYAYHGGTRWAIVKVLDRALTRISNYYNASYADGAEVEVRLEARGSTLRLILDGTEVLTATDTSIATGSIGIRAYGRDTPRMIDFGGGSL